MDILKKIFPVSFGSKDIKNLIIRIAIYLVLGLVFGLVAKILGGIPIINYILGVFGTIIGIYVVGGIIVAILSYLKIIK